MEPAGIKVLMISTDRNEAVEYSAAAERMKEYGEQVEELHIVLLSDRKHGLKNVQLSGNVWVYPTNSFSRWLRPLGAARLGKKIIFDKKFVRGRSLITAQDPFEAGWAGRSIQEAWRLPLEVQLHTDPFSPYFSGFLNSIRKRIAEKVIRAADSIRVVSAPLKNEVVTRFGREEKDVSVLPIYVDIERIQKEKVAFDLHARYGWHFIILMVSRLTAEKNIPLGLEAFSRLKKFFPDSGLVIVGSGPEERALKARVKELGLKANVAFAGWQEHLASYYRSANLFLQTSKFEGYGLSLIEAGISGVPVVTTPVGVANELKNGQDAYICPQNDPEYVFKAMYDLLENNPKREVLKANLKHTLEALLIPREEYLKRQRESWIETAGKVKA
ncbi:MAG: Poly(Glycerol-phosphate) alpha-glucosyltransferase [Parcubacteria group bacterium]|nr:Poly(Glycerol-phosphate) alpha-glucosyltransferase [Parcubacteria group bacterium]